MLDAVEELAQKVQLASGAEQEQLARFVLNAINVPIRRFIIPLPDGRTPYLERFVLREENAIGGRDYLHIIYQPDGDRDPHDHPFDFKSTIVWGGYDEVVYVRWCAACDRYTGLDLIACERCQGPLTCKEGHKASFTKGQVNIKRAHHLHRITRLHDGPVVTLIERGPKVRKWGFSTPDGWEAHESYIKRKFPGAQPTEID